MLDPLFVNNEISAPQYHSMPLEEPKQNGTTH